MRPFLAEISGISPSRLRKGSNFVLRKSTEQKAIVEATNWFERRVIKNGWSEDELRALRSKAPSLLAGEERPYADFIYGLQTPGSSFLPLTIAFAEEADVLLLGLIAAYRSNDLAGFKQLILSCKWGEDVSDLVGEQNDLESTKEILCAVSSWPEVLALTKRFLDNFIFCLAAAADAEYCSTYFGLFKSRPLFLLFTPKLADGVDLNALENLPKRNLINKPYRRLLEFTHAIMVWRKSKCWPKKAVGRKELGEILELTDQSIGNIFDGTKNMNAKLFSSCWERICQNVVKCEPFTSPLLLFIVATILQNALIEYHPNQKLKSVLLIDEAQYERFWKWHRQRWASQLQEGTEVWPAWLD